MIKPKIGLALGGGGARGLAHIGVLKVFEREGIPIDALSGSSMGGLLGAAYAAGLSPSDLESEAVKMSRIRNLIRLLDLRPGRRGLFEGRLLRAYFAVMATSAFPGLLPPVQLAERVLIDGGTLDNVPADAVRVFGVDMVLAVDVTPPSPHDMSQSYSEVGNPWFKLIPGSFLDLYQAAMIAMSELSEIKLQKAKPDLVIIPALPKDFLVFTGFVRAAEAIAAGEKAAEEMLPRINELIRNTS